MNFEVIPPITNQETFANGQAIHELARLKKAYGGRNWRKCKGFANIKLDNGLIVEAVVMNWILCVDNTGYQASLETRKLYQHIHDTQADSLGMVKVIDESGDSYLYDKKMFVSIPIEFEKYLDDQLEAV